MARIDRVKAFFDENGIDWVDSHKNITQRCIGVCCPWCNDEDGYHLGIFLDTGSNFTCWRCGKAGPVWILVSKLLDGMSKEAFEDAIEDEMRYEGVDVVSAVTEILSKKKDVDALQEVEEINEYVPYEGPIDGDRIPFLVCKFLILREFTFELCEKYEAGYAPLSGDKWSQRLILPIRDDNDVVAYVGRCLLAGVDRSRYVNTMGSLSKRGILYGLDKWSGGGRMILVEGPLDVWRIGDEACATFGTNISFLQKCVICAHDVTEVVIAWDSDAYIKSLSVARDIVLFTKVKVLRLPVGQDPDTLGKDALYAMIDDADYI